MIDDRLLNFSGRCVDTLSKGHPRDIRSQGHLWTSQMIRRIVTESHPVTLSDSGGVNQSRRGKELALPLSVVLRAG
jgi:hypothetical protein